MLEFLRNLNPAILSAMIGALSALGVVVVKDLLIERWRAARAERRALVERRLTELYTPLWVGFGGEGGGLGNILQNGAAMAALRKNDHLLSDELRDIFQRAYAMGQVTEGKLWVTATDLAKLVELNPKVESLLKRDLEHLRGELLSTRRSSGWRRRPKQSTGREPAK